MHGQNVNYKRGFIYAPLQKPWMIPLVLCVGMAAGLAYSSDWSQFQHDAEKSGVNAVERISQLEPRFSISLENLSTATVFNLASAVVDGETIYVGTTGGSLVAVDRRTGAEVWRVQTNGSIRNSPIFINGLVIVASQDGVVRALDSMADGAEVWRFVASSPLGASPTAATISNESRLYIGATDGSLFCLRASDGNLLWTASTTGRLWGSPTVSESVSRVYVGSYDQRVYAFNAVDGNVEWITDPVSISLGPVRASLALLGSRLYVATLTRGLVALEDMGTSVDEKWRVSLTGSHTGSPAVVLSSGLASATIYVVDDGGRIFAVEDRGGSGVVVWDKNLGERISGSVAYADNLVFVATENKTLRAFGAGDGVERFVVSTTASIDSSPVISNGNVFVSDASGRLYAFGNELEPPEGLSAIADGDNVVLTWQPVLLPPSDQPVSGYNIYRSTQPDSGFVLIAFVDGLNRIIFQSTSLFIDTSVTVTGTYFYAITALEDVAGTSTLEESTFSNIVRVDISISLPGPPEITGLVARAGDGIVTLNWSVKVTDAPVSRFHLFRREGTTGPLLFTRTISAGTTSFEDIRVENRVEYSYALIAIDVNDEPGPQSPEVSSTPLTVDWPMFQRDMLHEAFDPGQNISPPLGERWRVKLSEGPFNPGGASQGFSGYQGGLIVSGTLYVVSVGGDVRAYNAETGTTLWFESGLANVLASPAYHNCRLYITHNDGLTVLKADTGQVDWALPRAEVGSGLESSPIIYKGVVYAGMGLGGAPRLVAVDIETRTVKWTSEPRTVFLKSSPGAVRGKIYIVDGGGNVIAYRADDGATLWSASLGAFVTTTEGISLAVCPPVVLVAHENGFLHAFDAETGDLKWRELVFSRFTSPAVAGVTVFIASHNVNTVYARNVITGALVWTATTFSGSASHGAPVVAGGRLHVYATNGQVFTLDLATGAQLDVLQLTNVDVRTSHLSAGAGQLYVPTVNAKLIAVTPVTLAPVGVTTQKEIGQVRVSWTQSVANVFAVNGYRIFRSAVASDVGTAIGEVSGQAVTEFFDTTVVPGQVFFYRVAAIDVRGVQGQLSEPASGEAFLQPNIVAQIDSPVVGSLVCLGQSFNVIGTAKSNNFVRYTLEVNDGSGFVLVTQGTSPVDSGVLGAVTVSQLGTPTLRLTVFDETGQTGQTIRILDAPAEALTAEVSWPLDGQIIPSDCDAGPVGIQLRGKATGANFSSYRLELARQSSPGILIFEFEFTTAVPGPDGVLGDVRLPDCDTYVIRLVVKDVCGRSKTVKLKAQFLSGQQLVVNIITFSTRGKDSGKHRRPKDVAVDREDFVWVADTQNRRLQKYTADGQLLLEAGAHRTGRAEGLTFKEPVALAVDSQNQVLVLDRLSGEIIRLDDSGNLLETVGGQGKEPGKFLKPTGLAVDAEDRIYVADTLNNRVQVLAPSGEPVLVFGSQGTQDGQFEHPSGIGVDPLTGNILVVDTHNHRLQIFSETGEFLRAFGSEGGGAEQFNHPYDLVVGREHHLFISEVHNDRLTWRTLFGVEETLVTVVPPISFTGTLFKHPHGIALDTQETTLYVADTGNNRIVAIRIKSTVSDTILPRALISSPAVDTSVSSVVDIRGIAADARFDQYILEVGEGRAQEQIVFYDLIVQSDEPVWNGSLGLWDTRNLESGEYTLRLSVKDKAGNISQTSVVVQVEALPPVLIVGASVFPKHFSVEQGDVVITYILIKDTAVQIVIVPSRSNGRVWTSELFEAGEFGGRMGTNHLIWDGRSDHGVPVHAGEYVAVVLARRGELTDKKTLTLTALPTPEGLAGGSAGGGSALISSPAGAAVSAGGGSVTSASGDATTGGASDGSKGNKGVRDHGRGEGRDGAGQGKGKGRKK